VASFLRWVQTARPPRRFRSAPAWPRVQDLGEYEIRRMEMKIIGVVALAAQDAQDLRHAVIGIANPKSPPPLESAAKFGVVETASPPNKARRRPRLAGASPFAQHLIQDRGIRRGA